MGQGLNLVSLVSIWSCYDDSGVHEGWHFMFCLAKHIFSHIKHMRLVFNVDVFLCRRHKLPLRWDPKFGSRTLMWHGLMGRS